MTKSGSTSHKTGPEQRSTFKDMISSAINHLKYPRSSRPAIRNYILSNYKTNIVGTRFSSLLNNAIKKGVQMGYFSQPKGSSGPLKLAPKKSAKKSTMVSKSKLSTPKKSKVSGKRVSTAAKSAAIKKKTLAKPKLSAQSKTKKHALPHKKPTPAAKKSTKLVKKATPAKHKSKSVLHKTPLPIKSKASTVSKATHKKPVHPVKSKAKKTTTSKRK